MLTFHLSVSHLRGSMAAAARLTLAWLKGTPALLNMVRIAAWMLAGSQKSSSLQMQHSQQ